MANFVFVLGSYYPEADANVICAKNVIDELIKTHHNVYCVCGTSTKSINEKYGNIEIHRIHHRRYDMTLRNAKSNIRKNLLKISHTAKNIVMVPFFPETELSYSNKLYREIEKINKDTRVDCVIGIFRPFDTIWALTKFKEKHPESCAIGIFFDIQKEANVPFGISRGMFSKLCDKGELRYFKKMDTLMVPKAAHHIYINSFFESVAEKFVYVDFPVFRISKSNTKKENSKIKKIVYAGTTNRTFRNPMFMAQVMSAVTKNDTAILFEMYGKSEMEEELSNFDDDQRFKIRGLVSKNEADMAIDEAQILISIGNADSLLLPSKIFELFSTKKPILHFAKNEMDIAIKYMEAYPNSCIVYEKDGVEKSVEKVEEFIKKPTVRIEDHQLLDLYKEATPEYFTKIILRAYAENALRKV